MLLPPNPNTPLSSGQLTGVHGRGTRGLRLLQTVHATQQFFAHWRFVHSATAASERFFAFSFFRSVQGPLNIR